MHSETVNLPVAVWYDGPMDGPISTHDSQVYTFLRILEMFPLYASCALGFYVDQKGDTEAWRTEAGDSVARARFILDPKGFLDEVTVSLLVSTRLPGLIQVYLSYGNDPDNDREDLRWILSSGICTVLTSQFIHGAGPRPVRPLICTGLLPDCYLPPVPVGGV